MSINFLNCPLKQNRNAPVFKGNKVDWARNDAVISPSSGCSVVLNKTSQFAFNITNIYTGMA